MSLTLKDSVVWICLMEKKNRFSFFGVLWIVHRKPGGPKVP